MFCSHVIYMLRGSFCILHGHCHTIESALDSNDKNPLNQLTLSHHIPGCEPVVHGEEECKLCEDWLSNYTQGKHINQDIISVPLSPFPLR